MVRSFTVKTDTEGLVSDIEKDLNKKLVELQENGWKIINVILMPKESIYPKYFDTIIFVIIAEHDDE